MARTKTRKKREQSRQKRLARKRAKRRKQLTGHVNGHAHANARTLKEIKKRAPVAWPGERPEDVALFDDSVLEGLPPELKQEVTTVRNALQHVAENHAEKGVNAVSHIPRKSPMSDWRQLIRGLEAWLREDWDAAQHTWSRLDPDRRPARIAQVLMAAPQSDLENLEGIDDAQIKSARLVRRIRISRSAIHVARIATSRPMEVEDSTIDPELIKWLKEFVRDYQSTEPQLVTALCQAALRHALEQPYIEILKMAVKDLPGPPHDPKNYWLANLGLRPDDNAPFRWCRLYVEKSLPLATVDPPLKTALASMAWLTQALILIEPDPHSFITPLIGGRLNGTFIEQAFQNAIKACPQHEKAHSELVQWLESKLEDELLYGHKSKIAAVEQKLVEAFKAWNEAIPDATRPHKFLAEYFMEHGQFVEARTHVQRLAETRPKEPQLRILPWKLLLFNAMEMARRKSNLPQIPEILAQVEAQWPDWLAKDWLPYFHAALTLRAGQQADFEKQRDAICQSLDTQRDSLVDACRMLGAAQLMHVPSPRLKPLREPINRAVKNLAQVKTDELIDVGAFYWDLTRINLTYPAHRMHASKFGKELFQRIKRRPKPFRRRNQDPSYQSCVLWFTTQAFWTGGPSPLFDGYRVEDDAPPMFIAAQTSAAIKCNAYPSDPAITQKIIRILKQAASHEKSSYYRFWFSHLAEKFEEQSIDRRSPFQFFERFFAAMDGADDFFS